MSRIIKTIMILAKKIKNKALEIGFDLVGITDASPIASSQINFLNDWLKAGFAGQMMYMHRNIAKRTNPAKLLKNAQSVIVVGLNYTPARKTQNQINKLTGKAANFAQYEDYHQFLKKQLRILTDYINSLVEEKPKFKICVDSVPLAERSLAARAGLGFIGKNHMLTNPKLGNQILLGEIITTLKLQIDKPIKENCSNCNKCIDVCPTKVLRTDGQFDAGKCISYLTIEYKNQISPILADKIGNKIFGCDECALVCPYQQRAPACKNKQFRFYSKKANLNLKEILSLDPKSFEKSFSDSPIKRLGLDNLKRNAKICLSNINSQKTTRKT